MFVLAEFELFEDEDMVLALPFELEGGTEGYDFQDAAAMAADWLRAEAEPPKLGLSHASRHGGQVVIIGVSVSLEAIDTVTASEAAELLGVSRPRITQMIKAGRLEGYTKGHATFVTRASAEARLVERPRPGRPRRRQAATEG